MSTDKNDVQACCHKQDSLTRGASSSVCRDKQTSLYNLTPHSMVQQSSMLKQDNSQKLHKFWYLKTEMVWLRDGEKV